MIIRRFAALLLTVALVPATVHAGEKRPIRETDLFDFTWIGDPQISPDGTQIVFVRVNVNEEKDRYETTLCMVSADGKSSPRPFTAGPFDGAPRWSPDGTTIAFVRAVEKDGKPQPGQIHLIPVSGGEARALTSVAMGASSPAWSPDGKRIAFTSTTLPEDTVKADPKKKPSDVRVITRAIYRLNGAGFIDSSRRDHIFVVDASLEGNEQPRPRQITTGTFDEGSPVWSRDGALVYFISTRELEAYYQPEDSDLYSVPAAGGEIVRVASIDGTAGDFSLSPDGKQIAFTGTMNANPVRSYDQPDLFVTSSAPGSTPRNLTADYDFDVDAGISADQHAPRSGSSGGVVWSPDGKSVLVRTAVHGSANLQRIRVADGRMEPFTSGNHEVMSYVASANGAVLAVTISSATEIGDLFVTDGRRPGANLKRITDVNGELFANLDLGEPEEIWYESFDGRKIQGWILKPPGFDPAVKYPFILQIHGGPHLPYGNAFTHEFLWMAAKGYVVLYTNPRGSTSYGQEFGNLIQFKYPGDDYKDLMAGVDAVIKRGYVDEKKLGVTGGSGGGILTNWIITQTPRFVAAVSQRSIADWYGFWFTTDFWLNHPQWFHGAPWEDPTDFAARSPITHVAEITTPLMLVDGDLDLRTPPGAGGEAMFRALKYLKKPVVMVRFPGETHELSRSGAPRHRVERLQHIVGWFDQYLQGVKSDTYVVK